MRRSHRARAPRLAGSRRQNPALRYRLGVEGGTGSSEAGARRFRQRSDLARPLRRRRRRGPCLHADPPVQRRAGRPARQARALRGELPRQCLQHAGGSARVDLAALGPGEGADPGLGRCRAISRWRRAARHDPVRGARVTCESTSRARRKKAARPSSGSALRSPPGGAGALQMGSTSADSRRTLSYSGSGV